MERRPEPEVMDGEAQARAYAQADFTEAHNMFITRFAETFPRAQPCRVLDLGCGAADISMRFAHRFLQCTLCGVDASEAMLAHGQALIAEQSLQDRVTLLKAYLPDASLDVEDFDTVISNSLLHHLNNPLTLWQSVKRYAGEGALVFIMDLLRPNSVDDARALVTQYAAEEPAILQHDFYHSLLAAYTLDEIKRQLDDSSLTDFQVEQISDRHVIAYGVI